MPNRALVLDANILIRAVLGIRVRRILETYGGRVLAYSRCNIPEREYFAAQDGC